ncbi:hypothetical protein TNCV_3715531 [Trichonephila clavipes]|nr:hypothetical protein TNCV_3715531 [Trichonephila clavipes]
MLKSLIVEEWNEITPDETTKLVDSMPNRNDCIRQIISVGFTPSAKTKANHCPSFLLGADRQWSCHLEWSSTPNVYERRRVTRCIEALPTTPHLELDTSVVAKSWKEQLQKYLYILTFPRKFTYWNYRDFDWRQQEWMSELCQTSFFFRIYLAIYGVCNATPYVSLNLHETGCMEECNSSCKEKTLCKARVKEYECVTAVAFKLWSTKISHLMLRFPYFRDSERPSGRSEICVILD